MPSEQAMRAAEAVLRGVWPAPHGFGEDPGGIIKHVAEIIDREMGTLQASPNANWNWVAYQYKINCLRAALKKYGMHTYTCSAERPGVKNGICDCGLSEALATGGGNGE